MSDLISRWQEKYIYFATFRDFRDPHLPLFHRGDAPDQDLTGHLIVYMTHYPDVLHHPKEILASPGSGRGRPGTVRLVEGPPGKTGRRKKKEIFWPVVLNKLLKD